MTVTGALNNVIDNLSALLLRKRLTSLFLPRKPVSGKPIRKQETISMWVDVPADPIKGVLLRKSLLVTSKRLKGRCYKKTRLIK